MASIDYQKAFGSVTHTWIIKSLQLIAINNIIISFTTKTMSYCKTSMCLHTERKKTETGYSAIQHAIFQGNILSTLPFCISLIPTAEQLNAGYEEHMTKTKVSHIHYMNDLKLIDKTKEELQKQMQVIITFYIHVEFGLDNCEILYSREEN
jgi:hypothetical protein